MQTLAPDLFSLHYNTELRLLHGRWLRSSGDEDLYPAYQQLLDASKAHNNCRYWLLDMRQRSWHTAGFTAWFSDLLAHQVVREVGAPVFVAYVADEAHRGDIESVATDAMLRHVAQIEFYPYFFSSEAAALEWLVYYQAHPDQLPATQQSRALPHA